MVETYSHDSLFSVINDYPYLALVDLDAYEGFVDENWTDEQLYAHFVTQMAEKRLLLWFSTFGSIWQIAVRHRATAERGFRTTLGPIVVSKGRLLVTSFEGLSMVAQFDDAFLPDAHERDQIITLPTGEYQCRIIQRDDLGAAIDSERQPESADFTLELSPCDQPLSTWTSIAWDDLRLVRRSILDDPDPDQVASVKLMVTKILTPPGQPVTTVLVEFFDGVPTLDMILVSETTGKRWQVRTIGLSDPQISSVAVSLSPLKGQTGAMNLASLEEGILISGERLRAFAEKGHESNAMR